MNIFGETDAPRGEFSAVSAGSFHTCALRTDGTITCWGNNETGQADAPAGRYTAVSAGDLHTCALRTDDTLTCWGDNRAGQSDPPAGQFTAISAGFDHTCGIRTDDTLTCWGDNRAGQSDPPTGQFAAISAGFDHTCGIRTDDTLTCWGDDEHGQTDAPRGEFSAVTAGVLHTCALRTDGTITCWGYNEYGQTDAPQGHFDTVSAGRATSCALNSEGTITCWGRPIHPPIGYFNTMAAGSFHTCGIRTDDTVTCWGNNSAGQADPPAGQFAKVSAGFDHTCGIRTDDTVTCWGDNEHGQADPPAGQFATISAGFAHTCGIGTDDTVTCWGDNRAGQADPPAGQFTAISAGAVHTCGIQTDNTITCWGDNRFGQVVPPIGEFRTVNAGGTYSCGLRADDAVDCWGFGRYGYDGYGYESFEWDEIFLTFGVVSEGPYHWCRLRTDGRATCWDSEELGHGDAPAGRFRNVSAGRNFACGLRLDSTISCWDSYGLEWLAVPDGRFESVSVSEYLACGVRIDDKVTCWSEFVRFDGPNGHFALVAINQRETCGIRADRTLTCWLGLDEAERMEPAARAPSQPTTSRADDETQIGFGSLIGVSGDYSVLAGPRLDGAGAAIAEINAAGGVLGRAARLVVEDSGSTAEGAVRGYRRMRDAIHVLGGVDSYGVVALLEIVAEDEMPTMCPGCRTTALRTERSDYVWQLSGSSITDGVIAAQVARDAGHSRVAVLAMQAEWAETSADVFRSVWENKIGGEIVADVRFAPGGVGYRAELEEVFAHNPEAVYLVAGYEAEFLIVDEYVRGGYSAPLLLSPDPGPDIAEIASDLAPGRVLATSITEDLDSPAYARFVEVHRLHTGWPPPTGFVEASYFFDGANYFDQYIALALAITAAGSTDGSAVRAQIPQVLNAPGTKVYSYADGVAALRRGEEIDYDGASGSLELNPNGDVVSLPVRVLHITDGHWSERAVFVLDPALDPSTIAW